MGPPGVGGSTLKCNRASSMIWSLSMFLFFVKPQFAGGKLIGFDRRDEAGREGTFRESEGAIFRRIFNRRAQRITDRRLAPRNVAAIAKQGAARLGFDPSTFGGHSLRAGFVTSAVKRGSDAGFDRTIATLEPRLC